MLNKNEEYVGVVERLGSNGEGVLKNNGIVVFVPNVLPDEKIKYKILKATKTYAYGKVLEVLAPADDRVRAVCPVFEKCGGCQLQHLFYPSELKFKADLVADCFKRIGNLDVEVKPTVKNLNEYGYRNKLQLPVASKNGENLIGFYAENSHRVIPIKHCYIQPAWAEKLISTLKEFMSKYHILGYDEDTNKGIIKHIVVRETGNGYIVTLVSKYDNIPNLDKFIEALKGVFNDFSLYVNVNEKNTNVIFGDKFILKYGNPFYSTELYGIKCEIGVQSFMQVNTYIAGKIYQNVVKLASLDEDVSVIDAYSGAGLMTAMLAKKAKHAYGIEIIEEAVKIADNLAIKNNLADKMTNYCGDCAILLPPLVEKLSKDGNVVVVLDPPRKGCAQNVLDAIKNSSVDKIIYVSCNPATLARDVGLLVGSLYFDGAEIKRANDYKPQFNVDLVKPYDMFSQTKHVETLVALTRV